MHTSLMAHIHSTQQTTSLQPMARVRQSHPQRQRSLLQACALCVLPSLAMTSHAAIATTSGLTATEPMALENTALGRTTNATATNVTTTNVTTNIATTTIATTTTDSATETQAPLQPEQPSVQIQPNPTDARTPYALNTLPLYEVGLVSVANYSPYYPAAGKHQSKFLVVPYMLYRGKKLQVEDGKARFLALSNSRFDVDLSFGGALPSKSSGVAIREGMPDLEWLFEVGPQLVYRINPNQGSDGQDSPWKAHLKARAVFATNFKHISQRGWLIEPRISYQRKNILGPTSRFNASVGAIWATEKLHDYFYQVDSPYVTSQRSQYNARAGYLGSDLRMSFSTRVLPSVRWFSGLTVNLHKNAANERSPLFERNTTFAISTGFIWRFYSSDEQVQVRESAE
jgi:MipA family protein